MSAAPVDRLFFIWITFLDGQDHAVGTGTHRRACGRSALQCPVVAAHVQGCPVKPVAHGMAAVMLARRRTRGGDGKRKHAVHLVPIPKTRHVPAYLIAWCGARLLPGAIHILPSFPGMPCQRCLANAPMPTEQATDTDV
jgi:hypothetical protein